MGPRLLFALLLCCSVACDGGARDARPNVILIVADTTRRDKLGCYGDGSGLTPNVDRLAQQGALFEQASGHAPWTLPSSASLLTSLLPQQHGAGGHLGKFTALDPGVETLAERFRGAGYATASIVNVDFLGPVFGLTRGFEHSDVQAFASNVEVRRADATTTAALTWIDRVRKTDERPFLLLVHYFDAHAVYDPPQPFRRRFAAEADREDTSFVFGTRDHMLALRRGTLALDPAVLARAERLYEGEIAYMDQEIGRLLDGLTQRQLDAGTIVCFTTDHGEEFLDHGGFEHGHSLHAELIDVPLILRGPDIDPRRVAEPVRHIDVLPTLCELTGMAVRPSYAGRSLVPALLGEPLPPAPTLAHGNFWGAPLSSLRAGSLKVIVDAASPGAAPALYDWHKDAREVRDLGAAEASAAGQLAAELARLEATLGQKRGGAVELDPHMQDTLTQLGYMGDSEDED